MATRKDSPLILVTGATRGLGRAMVDGFIGQGCTVAGCGRSTGAIEALREQHGEPHRFSVTDVASDAEVADWASEVLEALGPPDWLINNAGVTNRPNPLWAIADAEFSRVVDVNIKGVANTIRHFVPAMVERGRGVIVNFSSGWGRSTAPHVAPYCTTKWAIEGLTSALAQELPHGMAAVAYSPGVIHTDMLEVVFGGQAAGHQTPDTWARKAVPGLLKLGRRHNGKSISA